MAQMTTKFVELFDKLRDKGYEVQPRTEGKWVKINVRDIDGEELPWVSDKPQDESYYDFLQDLKQVFNFGDEELDRIQFMARFEKRAAAQEARREADPTWNPAIPARALRDAQLVLENTKQRSEFVLLDRDTAREILWEHLRASEERGYGLDADLEALARGEEAFFSQRKYSDRHGTNLIDAMERGEWKLTHQGVGIAADGFLLDGQHRVTAVASSGIPIPIKIDYNVDDSVIPVVDTGKGRSAGDVLAMLGVKDGGQIATVIRLLNNYDTYRDPDDWYTKSMSNEQIFKLLVEKYMNITDAYAVARSLSQAKNAKTYLSRSAMTVAHYVITRAWPEAPIMPFWTNVQGGNIDPYWHDHYEVKHYDDNPGHALHRWAFREEEKTRTQGARRVAGQAKNMRELIMILRAWNDINDGVVRQRYQWIKLDEAPKPYRP